ncbi:DUF4388 domain-containing protein [Egicoccus sp. AB-alg6-2]|uniref:DUF4388 domain-containing protein n=1 Tax=Egicoccus sp. AB-alg6-2 TaxID=3242692 RepID=UPI00359D9E3E
MSAVLEGQLGDFRLLDILQLLNASAKTGRLELDAAGVPARLDVREGLLTEISPAGDASDRLPGSPADDGDLRHDARVDGLVDLLSLRSGRFHFEGPAEQSPAPDTPRTDPLLEEARRRLQEWPQLTERVGGRDAVLALAAPHHHNPVTLTADRWRLVSLVDGRRPVAELAAHWGRGDYAAHRALAELLDEGLIAPAAATDVPATPITEDAAADEPTVAEVPVEPAEVSAEVTMTDEPGTDEDLFARPEPAPAVPVAAAETPVAEPAPAPSIPAPPAVVYEGSGPRGLHTRVRAERLGGGGHDNNGVDQNILQRLIHGVEKL